MAKKKISLDNIPVTFNNVLVEDLVELLFQASNQKCNVTYYKPMPDPKSRRVNEQLPATAIEMVRNTEETFVIPSSCFDWIQLYCDAHGKYFEVEPIKDGIKVSLWEPPYESPKYPRFLNDY